MPEELSRPSSFAAALSKLLDESELFDRDEWAQLLGVTPATIQEWVDDQSIPSSDQLSVLLDSVELSDGPTEPIRCFKEMAQRDAREVSPHGKLMLPAVRKYINRPLSDRLASRLAKLSHEGQAELLEEMYPLAIDLPAPTTAPSWLELDRHIGPAIKAVRIKRGIKQVQLAEQLTEKLGTAIGQSYISKLETGHCSVSWKRFSTICLVLQCEPHCVVKVAEMLAGIATNNYAVPKLSENSQEQVHPSS